MSDAQHLQRPATPPGFDSSRASERAADPSGWRFPPEQLQAVRRVIAERRDIRRFRPDPVPEELLERVLADAHRAPSVGLMQPWRLILVRALGTRMAIRRIAQRERIRQAQRFDARAREFLDKKIEGIVEAPLGICVCCDHGDPDEEILGRGTIRDTDVYSTACAIENLWLSARAEGLGVGWVSFYRPEDLRALLSIPAHVDPIAYLCLGWPDERPQRPGLEASGWARRMPLDRVVMAERWDGHPANEGGAREAPAAPGGKRTAMIAARDRLDHLVKPAGSLGALEQLIESWAAIAGSPPPRRIRAGVLVCAADHGHTRHGTSLFDSAVSAQVAAAAARSETAVGVLAKRAGHLLLVADVGLRGPTPAGVHDHKIASGSADFTVSEALSEEQLQAALALGARLADELIEQDIDCLAVGEIGIGNTTTAAALASTLTGLEPRLTVGRGTGLDHAGQERKRALLERALELHGSPREPLQALRTLGGLEFAALAGTIGQASSRGMPVILDGYATGVSALAAVRLEGTVGEALFASHRSAEPGHELLLAELGLEPLLDLRLRLGEASGALLAIPLLEAAGALHRDMATFVEAGVDDQRPGAGAEEHPGAR